MRFVSFVRNQETVAGLMTEEGKLLAFSDLDLPFADMNAWIEAVAAYPEWSERLELALADPIRMAHATAAAEAQPGRLVAPIPHPKQDIICLGVNYQDHAEEHARFRNEALEPERTYPVYFSKRAHELVGTDAPIKGHFDIVEQLDYEVELAVIIGRAADRVAPAAAADHIFGYSVFNDVSARVIQNRHKQWYFGKSLDGFAVMGPWIVAKEKIAWPPELTVRTYVNGELRQHSNTAKLIFDLAYVISELSQGMVLQPGTIIATGTPAGVGMGFDPPRFLKSGDQVVCEIEGIGRLENFVE